MPRTAQLLTLAFVATVCSTLSSVTARVLTEDSPSADSHEHTFQCGNAHVGPDRQAEIEAPIQQALAQRQSQRVAATSQPAAEDDAALITVPVYWHVIYQVRSRCCMCCWLPPCTAAHTQAARNGPKMELGFGELYRDPRTQHSRTGWGQSVFMIIVDWHHRRLLQGDAQLTRAKGSESPAPRISLGSSSREVIALP